MLADVCNAGCQCRFMSPLIFPFEEGIVNEVSGGEVTVRRYTMREDAEWDDAGKRIQSDRANRTEDTQQQSHSECGYFEQPKSYRSNAKSILLSSC